nr:DUF624 domain-containing protein [uncultured Sellimonas sp.]
MRGLFNLDNPFLQFLSRVCDLIILNLLFILTCIPIITIGASLSALYTIALKMVRNEESYIAKGYFKAFASNFKQSTVLWLISIVLFLFFRYDYIIASSQNTGMFRIIQVMLLMVILVFAAAFLYVFPVASHFVCTLKQVIKNSFLMSIGHLPYTLILFAIYGLIWFVMTYSVKTLGLVIGISMICGFSVTAYVTCIIFSKIFKKYEPEKEPEPLYPE